MNQSRRILRLLEKMNWAKDKSNAQYRYTFDRRSYVHIEVDLKKLWDNLDALSRFEDDNTQIGNRYERIGKHLENGGYLDPVWLYYRDHEDKFSISDGRHRLLWAKDHNEKSIPVFITKKHYNQFKDKFDSIRV